MLLGHSVAGGRRSLRRDSRQEQALDLARMGDTQALVGIEARLQHAQQACACPALWGLSVRMHG